MKKYNLFKVLAITVVVAWLLTLFIPGSSLDYSGNVTKGSIASAGIWGLLSNLNISISYFSGIAIFVIAVAIFYAVLSKVNPYNAFVEKVANRFSKKEGKLVIITTIIFGILSMFVSDSLILIVFLPFVYAVMSKLEIDKKAILSSTIVAGLIGSMCNIYNGTLFSTFNLKISTLFLVKAILLVVSLFVLIMFSAPKSEDEKASKETKKVKETKNETKPSKVVKTAKVTKVTVKKPASKSKKPATKARKKVA